MGDLTTYQVGSHTYEIVGLHTRADDLRGQASTAATLTTDLVDAASRALTDWRGPHADTFHERLLAIAGLMGELKWRLFSTARINAGFDDGRFEWLDPATGLR